MIHCAVANDSRLRKTTAVERSNRIRNLWAWLPAFRAIAETEHLPTASEALHVSASSLSRALHQLESDVGRPLFDRVGRRIVLNAAGKELLRATRDSMRRIDEAIGWVDGSRLVGPVHISMPGPFVPLYLLPALELLRDRHPDLVPHVTSVSDASVNTALLRGAIDVAVLDDPVPTDNLTLRELCSVQHALCCGPTHPLATVNETPSLEELEEHGFVAPIPLADGRVPDLWPRDRPRRVDLYVRQMQAGVDACASGRYLAVLPWRVAERAGLRRIPMSGIEGSKLYILHRPTLEEGGRTEAVVDALLACRDL